MTTYTSIVIIICMLLYTIYAVWQIIQFEHPVSGIFGTAAVIGGSFAVYHFIAPFIAAAIIWLLKVLGIIALLAIIGSILTE